ncbi:sugar porter family MFS transporter [Luteolibacter arcticus]|uniref:Sugar porter family MFS transporter n=1 Tax=Luteolibacter arcticus TaxID=1581411 RepID=A0ABT3GLR2_9BACT|nr:sugar porter family MFS transporter [Luteolibacter arcticus]MCW1924453.1 sugar porter family MFS transporter [Luteolibacter arcticus]
MNQEIPVADLPKQNGYLIFLILISGMGGLLAGIDYGIIAGALLYVDKTIPMSEVQQGIMVSIYVGGGVIASLFAGALADWLGRKKMMVAGGVIFITSILLIYVASGFAALLVGRILMGLSGGVICVVVPLYMAECLPSQVRGRGTSAFQFMMTLGFVLAAWIAGHFAGVHDAAVAAAKSDPELIFAADNDAWRNMFLVASIPGVLFSAGALFLTESPRWLFLRKREDQALAVLRMSRTEGQAALELQEMKDHGTKKNADGTHAATDSLLQRKYVVPFTLACIILACTQATGIGSILSYAGKILQGAGLSEAQATTKLQIITGINCVVTLLGAFLVDKLGRKILLSVATGGIVLSLLAAGLLYHRFESQRVDVSRQVEACISADGRTLSADLNDAAFSALGGGIPAQLSVLYAYDDGHGYRRQGISTAFSNAKEENDRRIIIEPLTEKKWATVDGKKTEEVKTKDLGKISILRAKFGPIPEGSTGLWITIALCSFIAFFAVGPGVCVWLALTELMPTRIRSLGMGVAMLLNTGVQFLSAFFFPTVVGNHGFSAMFFIWCGCTVIYFITAAFFLPETKGKTLEEIEDHFAGAKPAAK